MGKNTNRKCPYAKCKLGCANEHYHRARYSYISQKWKEKVVELDEEIKKQKKSPLINYNRLKELGIFYNLK